MQPISMQGTDESRNENVQSLTTEEAPKSPASSPVAPSQTTSVRRDLRRVHRMALHVAQLLAEAYGVADDEWTKDGLMQAETQSLTIRFLSVGSTSMRNQRLILDELSVLRDRLSSLEDATRGQEFNAGIRAAHADVLETLAWLNSEDGQ